MKLSPTEDTPHNLLLHIFENLSWEFAASACHGYFPQEFSAGICRGYLPRELAARICRGYLPRKYAAGISSGYLPWEFAVWICKQILFCIRKQILFIWKQTFFICEQNFLICEIFFISSVSFCYCRGSYGQPYLVSQRLLITHRCLLCPSKTKWQSTKEDVPERNPNVTRTLG